MTSDDNNTQELYELCRTVYELFPEWTDTLQCVWNNQVSQPSVETVEWAIESKYTGYHPLYTSDYLLEKLPMYVAKEYKFDRTLQLRHTDDDQWNAWYPLYGAMSDTPVKALLKLTIALKESGEL